MLRTHDTLIIYYDNLILVTGQTLGDYTIQATIKQPIFQVICRDNKSYHTDTILFPNRAFYVANIRQTTIIAKSFELNLKDRQANHSYRHAGVFILVNDNFAKKEAFTW